MKKLIFVYQVMALAILSVMASCSNDDEGDWSEMVYLIVDDHTVSYHPGEYASEAPLPQGLSVCELPAGRFLVLPMDAIEGFVYQEGYTYYLKVKKIHLSNPPADGLDVRYLALQMLNCRQTSETDSVQPEELSITAQELAKSTWLVSDNECVDEANKEYIRKDYIVQFTSETEGTSIYHDEEGNITGYAFSYEADGPILRFTGFFTGYWTIRSKDKDRLILEAYLPQRHLLVMTKKY